MIYQGKAIKVQALDNDIAELQFDLQGESVNKFDQATLAELQAAVSSLNDTQGLKGLVVTSAKKFFIVGADINEFTTKFTLPREELVGWIKHAHSIFNGVEDLPFPTVVAVNGMALGGGYEMCLACDYRVASEDAQVGLPETKLGIIPGFGGTVRLPRLIGSDNAIEMVASGKPFKAAKALQVGAVDAVVSTEILRDSALDLLSRCISGEIDYKARRAQKMAKLKLNAIEGMLAFESAKGMVAAQAGPHYPAPIRAVKTIQKAATFARDKAIEVEIEAFADLAQTSVAQSLVGLFLNDQALKKSAKQHAKIAANTERAAVLGAGIMGGGIAYQSASKGTPVLMKDISQAGIDLGLDEAGKLCVKQVERKRMKPAKMAQTLNSITPTLNYGDFSTVDLVVEAVVENPNVKKAVLAECEKHIGSDKVLTSNTSTISITELATALERPENFCGMHFFNPVHMMPLVEVIRGEKTSDETVATVVKYASSIGKTPVVVRDCPGFLVNRILFPYFGGFSMLMRDGADFENIDRVMERFGWPMGPAYLADVVGIDTCVHGDAIMAEGYPERMAHEGRTALDVMNDEKRLGQKNSLGFYAYELDKRGKQKKVHDEQAHALMAANFAAPCEFSDEDIIARMMIPMCLETVRCLEDGIVDSAADVDMALIMGVGFPPFRGGALRYIDSLGAEKFCELADQYAELGPLYAPTEKLREMAKTDAKFFA